MSFRLHRMVANLRIVREAIEQGQPWYALSHYGEAEFEFGRWMESAGGVPDRAVNVIAQFQRRVFEALANSTTQRKA